MDKNTKNKLFWIYALSSIIYFAQGIEGLPGLSLFLYLKEVLHFSAEKIMYISSITGLAWVIKPIWGYLSDNYLSKKTWILLSLLGSLLIALYFGTSNWLPISVLIIMIGIANYNAAMRDVSIDGIMCVEGKICQNTGKIQAIQWGSITLASIFVGLGGGYIAEHFSYKIGYLCLIPIYVAIAVIVFKYKTEKPQIFYSPIVSFRQPFLKQLLSYKELFIDKRFLFACLFLFLYKYSPSFGTPLSFIQRDSFKWSAMWMGTLGAIISALEILGAFLYFKFSTKINMRKWITVSVYLGVIVTLCYLYYTPVSAILYGILFAIVGMFIHLIIMDFMARSTIKGKEATSFALLCSISNLAATASSLSGAYLFPKIGLQPLIILSAVTSFACLPLIKKVLGSNESRN